MLTEYIQELADSQRLLKAMIKRLENHPVYSQDEYQAFYHDTVDYCETLSVVTYLAKTETGELTGSHRIRELLQQQYAAMTGIIQLLATAEGQREAAEAYEMISGASRRLAESLKGILELNLALQKEEDIQIDFSDPELAFDGVGDGVVEASLLQRLTGFMRKKKSTGE